MTRSSESEVVTPTTENTFVATASGTDDPPTPIKGVRRLLAWIIPANLGIFLIWGAVPGILLPQQVTLVDPANKVANLAIVMTISALAAMLAQPIAGQLSDRTRSRFGRRAPWIVLGALVGGLGARRPRLREQHRGDRHRVGARAGLRTTSRRARSARSCPTACRCPAAARSPPCSGIGLMVGALGGQIIGSLLVDSLHARLPRVRGLLARAR